jgi:Rieske Fe-S protein
MRFTEGMTENLSATRRNVIVGAGAGGVVAVLAGCGASDAGAGTMAPEPSTGGEGANGAQAGPGEKVPTSEIPVKGGKVFKNHGLVVTQPAAGDFKAFSAICPHRGCMVGKVSDNVINCPCHDSEFSAEDGSVKKGPATQPLAAKQITVTGDTIILT